MSLSALEIERRVGNMLAARVRNSGQLAGLDDEQLAGIGKKLKKVAKKVGKVVKKIAPIAVGGVATVFGGPVGGAVAGSVLKKKKKKKSPKAVAAVQQAIDSGAVPPQGKGNALETAAGVAQSMFAQQAPYAANDPGMQQIMRQAVASEMSAPSSGGGGGSPGSLIPGTQPTEQLDEVTITANKLKPYLIPGAIGAGLLVLMMMNSKKRKG